MDRGGASVIAHTLEDDTRTAVVLGETPAKPSAYRILSSRERKRLSPVTILTSTPRAMASMSMVCLVLSYLRTLVDEVERLEVKKLDVSARAGSPIAPMTEVSIASWFSVCDAYVAMRTTSSVEKGP